MSVTPIEQILKILNEAGYESFLVGGFVRDTILYGTAPENADYDVTTNALPEEFGELFRKNGYHVAPTGIAHGTQTIFTDDISVEITTYRTDGKYTDSRHPDSVEFVSSLKDDLSRRDFTINAIAWNPNTGYIDYFGGREDISRKIIRTVGNPEDRFTEDALRILRAIRFASVLDMEIEPKTQEAIHKLKGLLHGIAGERIVQELSKLVFGKNLVKVLNEYSDVICEIIPEFKPSIGFDQHTKYHCYDVWNHTLHAVASADDLGDHEANRLLRLTLLFHDIGKPDCYTESQDKVTGEIVGHMYGHGKRSAEITRVILNRLHMSKFEIDTITTIIAEHTNKMTPDEKCIKKFLCRIGTYNMNLLLAHHFADNRAKPQETIPDRIEFWQGIKDLTNKVISEAQCFSMHDLAITGSDLIASGIPEGPQVGLVLRTLLSEVIEDKLPNEKSALLSRALSIKS